jgi:DNA helicase-2/ATP-dependent DNA helicase PcrA
VTSVSGQGRASGASGADRTDGSDGAPEGFLDEIVVEELRLLELVRARIAEAPEPTHAAEGPIVRELERLREVLVAGSEAKDAAALHQQWHRQSSLLRQLRASREAPQVDPRSPYFAHLRLREDGSDRDLCLGHATCISGGVRIVDWRNAPISKVFYRYEQGENFDEELAGRSRSGEIVVRRTLGIQDGVLNRVEAPEGVFTADPEAPAGWRREARGRPRLAGGEATAMRAHGIDAGTDRRLGTDLIGTRRRADKRLPEITGLIDPEQFGLITQPASGFLVIRGSAGSGKTTVALHRIAYLCYDDPEIDSERTLFIAFSPAMRSYVGHVLPSLGVNDVGIVTYSDWASQQRRRHFPALPNAVREGAPAVVESLKLHPALAVALRAQVERVAGPASADQAVDDWASVLTAKPLLQDVFAREAPGVFSSAEIERAVEWSQRRNEELFAWMAGDRDVQAELDAEDDTLLLRAWQLRVGPLRRGGRPLRYRHVAVDEVQEFSPIEVQVLLECLDDRRSITLAGDTQQHLVEHGGFSSWAAFLDQLGVSGAEIETLRVSYRSSREIVAFARGVLGELCEDEAPLTTRSGPPVELFRFTDSGACVAFLSDALRRLVEDEPLASVAVLTPSTESSEVYFHGLAGSDLVGLRRVAHQDFTFKPGVEVTEIGQAQGLEFDYVVLVDVDATRFVDTASARRTLHVGATRAIHQLWLTSVGTPSPLVASLGVKSG